MWCPVASMDISSGIISSQIKSLQRFFLLLLFFSGTSTSPRVKSWRVNALKKDFNYYRCVVSCFSAPAYLNFRCQEGAGKSKRKQFQARRLIVHTAEFDYFPWGWSSPRIGVVVVVVFELISVSLLNFIFPTSAKHNFHHCVDSFAIIDSILFFFNRSHFV